MTAADVDVSVAGRGPVGAAGALALAGMGLRVALPAPSASDGRADIRAYALNAPSRSLLQHLKVWPALPPDAVTPVYDMLVHGDTAGSALAFSAWTQKVEALAWIVDAAELDRALQAALQFAPHVRRMPAGATLPPAALRVIAEGKAFAGGGIGMGKRRSARGWWLTSRIATKRVNGFAAPMWWACCRSTGPKRGVRGRSCGHCPMPVPASCSTCPLRPSRRR
jgi:hypothetical protein